MATTKIEQEFRKQTNKMSKQTITGAVDSLSYVFDQLSKKYKQLSSDKQDAYKQIAEFLDKVQKVKTTMNEINKIDFNSITQEQIKRQQQYAEKIQQIQESMSMLNMDIVSLSQNSLYDEDTRRMLDTLKVSVINQSLLDQLMFNVSLVNGDVDKELLQSEERIRSQLANIMGNAAYQITMPDMQYNPLGKITPTTSQEQVQQILQQNLEPYEKMQQDFIDLARSFRKQVKDAKEQKTKTEYEALQIIQDKIKALRGDEDTSEVNSLVNDFQTKLNKSLQEAKNAYGTASVLEYEEKFQSTVVDAMAEILAKQKALGEVTKTLRNTKATEFEKRITAVSMLKQTILAFEQKKVDFLLDYTKTLNEVAFSGEQNKLKAAHEALNDTNSQVYKDTMSQIQRSRMSSLAGTRLSTNLYGAIDTLAVNGGNIISSVSNNEYRNLVKNVQYQNQFLNQNLSNFLKNPLGANSPLDFNFDIKTVSPMISTAADAHIKLLSATGTNGFLYNHYASSEEKQALETTISASKEMLQMIDRALIVFEKIGKEDTEYKLLTEQKKSIEEHLKRIDDIKHSLDGVSKAISALKTLKNKATGLLIGGLGFFGVGALLSPRQTFMKIKDDMNQFGKMAYGSSIADLSMGLYINSAHNRMLSFGIPIEYFDMTYGNAGINIAADFYKKLSKNVGGHYGGGSPRADFDSFTKNLLPDKLLFGLSDDEMQRFLKTFYKDMGMSASEAMIKLRALEGYAISSNIPMQKTLSVINGMSEGMRVLGVNSKVLLNSITSIAGWHGLRIEDAQEMTQQTASAASKMSKDWGRSLFWGIMNGEELNPFDIISKGYLSHNSDGSVNDNYYDTMVDRLFKESTFFGSRWGEGSPLGTTDMMNKLMEQGYTMKQSSVLTQLYNEGKIDEVKAKLKGYDELKEDDAPEKKTREYTEQLKKSAEQLSEMEKIHGKFSTYFYRLANLFETVLGKQMNQAEKMLRQVIGSYTKIMTGLIARAGGFFNSPMGKTLLNTFAEHPFLTMGGTVAAVALSKYGMRKLATEGLKSLRTGKTTSQFNGMLAMTGAGSLIGGYNMEAGLMAQDAQGADVDSGQVLLRMLSDGKALARVLKGKKVEDTQESFAGAITSVMVAGGAPILAYMFTKSFLSYRTVKRFDKLFSDVQEKATSPHKAYPQKSKELKTLERRLAKNKKVSQAVIHRYQHLINAYQEKVKAYKERKRTNARIRRQNRLIDAQYRAKVAKRYSKLKNRGTAKSIAKMYGVNVLLSLLTSDADESVFETMVGAGVDTIIMGGLAKKFGVFGAVGGMALSSVVHDPIVDTIGSFFGQKAEASPLVGGNGELIQNDGMSLEGIIGAIDGRTNATVGGANSIAVSNKQLTQDMIASLEDNGVHFEDMTEREKRIWRDKFQEFLTIYGDYKMSIANASQYVTSMQVTTSNSYSGSMPSGAELWKQLQQKDPETAQMMQEAAQKYGVPVEDLCVIANIESGMNADVGTNSVGATGIMQNTSDHGTGYDIYTTRGNIFAGAYYYRQLLDQFNGNKAKALAGYNWEPNHDAFDLADWQNHLPEESSNYLVKAGLATGEKGNLTLTGNGGVSSPVASAQSVSQWTGDASLDGFSSDYFIKYESRPGATNLTNVKQQVKDVMNEIGQQYYQQTGERLTITGGAEEGIHADSQYGHGGGWKLDIDHSANIDVLLPLLNKYGVAAGDEGDHYDLSFSKGGVGGKLITNNATGNITPGARRATPNVNVQSKPATLKDTYEQNIKAYQQTMRNIGDTVNKTKGRIVNGMYIDANQKFISVEDSIKSLRENLNAQNQQMWQSTVSNEGDIKASQAYLNQQQDTIQTIEDAEQMFSMKKQKTEKIRKIVEKVQDIVTEYFDNPTIACDI